MGRFLILTLVSLVGPIQAAEYFVAPHGQTFAAGTAEDPWDLQASLNRSSPVRGGDTVWLMGGTYAGFFYSHLIGQEGNPIVVRGMRGERVTIDGPPGDWTNFPLTLDGAWTVYRDFEVIHSATWLPGALMPVAVQCIGSQLKLINLVVHDAGQGIGSWMSARATEIYGCLIYHNGRDSLEHGIYVQNDVVNGVKRIHDNLIFNNSGFGVHGYTQGGQLSGFDFQGNIVFNNGSKNDQGRRYDNIFVGGNPSADQITVISNFTYISSWSDRFNLRFSYGDHLVWPQGTIRVWGNWIVGGTGFTADDWREITFRSNVVVGVGQHVHCRPPSGVALSTYQFDDNAYHGSGEFGVGRAAYQFGEWRGAGEFEPSSSSSPGTPSGVNVFVRSNRYEPKRANIVVYNWDPTDVAQIDVSGVLDPGDYFEIRNAQDFYGKPVVSGVFTGDAVTLPLTNLSVAVPGGRVSGPAPTGKAFNAFVIQSAGAAEVAWLLGVGLVSEGTVYLEGQVAAGTIWQVEASSDPRNWNWIGTATGAMSGALLFIDETGPGRRARFYRLAK